jgi:glycosyltransferase involved in cell wall biosynthesis
MSAAGGRSAEGAPAGVSPGGVSNGLLVSVIVPARDERASLARLIPLLSAQTLGRDRFEVIIGDDGSTDGVADGPGDGDWLRIAPGPRRNSYAARNRAAALSRSGVLAFCDADCAPEPTWLEEGLAALAAADLVGGLIRPLVPERPSLWTLLDLDLHVDQRRAVASGSALGGNLFVPRERFFQLGGFDESLPNGGDFDFAARATESGARLELAPSAVVWHPTHDRPHALIRKIWRVQRARGVRNGRLGERPRLLSVSTIPVIGMARSRKRSGRPLGLDRERLEAADTRVPIGGRLGALAVMYLLLPQIALMARFAGWRAVQRERQAARA